MKPIVAGWRCAVCGAASDIATPFTWRCPNAGRGGHHAPQLVTAPPGDAARYADLSRSAGDIEGENPFELWREWSAWDAFAAANGLTPGARGALLAEVDARVEAAAGRGFRVTPFARAGALSDELGFAPVGGVWVKDETGNVAGSHKARHLLSIAMHLVVAETLGLAPWSQRPPLAIASCGNAAIAASTLAAALDWPIRVFVPAAPDEAMVRLLEARRADIVRCPRLAGDPPGDPCVHRFREAVAEGCVPFSVQGTENAWCLDGGRTIGWELAAEPLDRLFVQVGGGAFAACAAGGLQMAGSTPRLHTVQTESCAPLDRAWRALPAHGGVAAAAAHWDELMWPWEHVGASAADGILDDETYDWLAVVEAMAATGGEPVVVAEERVLAANDLARRATGIDVSATGSAGLAGLLATRREIGDGERVAVVFSGIARR